LGWMALGLRSGIAGHFVSLSLPPIDVSSPQGSRLWLWWGVWQHLLACCRTKAHQPPASDSSAPDLGRFLFKSTSPLANLQDLDPDFFLILQVLCLGMGSLRMVALALLLIIPVAHPPRFDHWSGPLLNCLALHPCSMCGGKLFSWCRFQAYGWSGGRLVLTLWSGWWGVDLYSGWPQCGGPPVGSGGDPHLSSRHQASLQGRR